MIFRFYDFRFSYLALNDRLITLVKLKSSLMVVIFIIGGITKVGESVHILKGDTQGQVCGCCGILHSGSVQKITTRNKASKAIVDCPYFKSFNYQSVLKLTKSNPSSNRPEFCSVCNSCLWSYNMLLHFQEKHHDVPCPFLISELEREAVLNFKI